MQFQSLPAGTIVIYSYRYSQGLAYEIAEVVEREHRTNIQVRHSSLSKFSHETSTETMDDDERCIFITTVPSIEEAFTLYPEYFI